MSSACSAESRETPCPEAREDWEVWDVDGVGVELQPAISTAAATVRQ